MPEQDASFGMLFFPDRAARWQGVARDAGGELLRTEADAITPLETERRV
jgi:hypothetical protein